MNTVEYLKSRCNRYANGVCTSTACLRDGGYVSGPPDYKAATCEYHDAVTRLEACASIPNPAAIKACIDIAREVAEAVGEDGDLHALGHAALRLKASLAALETEAK